MFRAPILCFSFVSKPCGPIRIAKRCTSASHASVSGQQRLALTKGSLTRGIFFRSAASKRAAVANKQGHRFEQRVVRLFKRLGKWNVQSNVRLQDPYGNASEIDVRFGIFLPIYVECKSYHGHTVPLEDVAKFKEVLRLNNISPRRGLFITTSTFSPRATTIGIRTWDGAQFRRMERRAFAVSGLRRMLVYPLLLLVVFCAVMCIWEITMMTLIGLREDLQNWWRAHS